MKCAILECETLIFDAISNAIEQPVDKDDKIPTNIWFVVGDVGRDALTYNTKSKITFKVVLFQIGNFRSWFEDDVCKEIMTTVFQIQQEDKNGDVSDETAFVATLKLTVVR